MAKPSSFPVGKVNFMQIDPMSFSGFCEAYKNPAIESDCGISIVVDCAGL